MFLILCARIQATEINYRELLYTNSLPTNAVMLREPENI